MIPYDLDAIAQSIQNIARSTAPIGTVMDCLPQELDRMERELNHWTEEYALHEVEFQKVKKKTEEDLKPFQDQVQEVDDDIQQIRESIKFKQAEIHKNNEWVRERLQRFSERRN